MRICDTCIIMVFIRKSYSRDTRSSFLHEKLISHICKQFMKVRLYWATMQSFGLRQHGVGRLCIWKIRAYWWITESFHKQIIMTVFHTVHKNLEAIKIQPVHVWMTCCIRQSIRLNMWRLQRTTLYEIERKKGNAAMKKQPQITDRKSTRLNSSH